MATTRSTGRTRRRPATRDAQLAEVAETSARRPTALIGFVLGALITVAVVLLIVQNPSEVPVAWLTAEGDLPLWAVVLGSFAAGLVVAPLLYAGFRLMAHRRRERLELIEQARG